MRVGWYVHHHGAGHAARLAATLPHLEGTVTALSSLRARADCPWVQLPLDLDDAPVDPGAGGTLHWAPVGHDGLRARMAAVAAWIASARPDVVVVDVSVEVALLARLLGVPTVVVAQRGVRTDPPHRLAYAQAAAVVAPWTAVTHLAGDGLPADERLVFAGAISRIGTGAVPPPSSADDVLLVLGAGGHGLRAADVVAAAGATPGRVWHVAGALRVAGPRVVDHGPAADVPALLARCGLVVGSAGGNVVAEVAAARRPFVCLPQARPFAEQERQGEALRRLGVAEVLPSWPQASAWPAVLAAAQARDTELWAQLHDGEGARRLASAIRAAAVSRRCLAPSAHAGTGTGAGLPAAGGRVSRMCLAPSAHGRA